MAKFRDFVPQYDPNYDPTPEEVFEETGEKDIPAQEEDQEQGDEFVTEEEIRDEPEEVGEGSTFDGEDTTYFESTDHYIQAQSANEPPQDTIGDDDDLERTPSPDVQDNEENDVSDDAPRQTIDEFIRFPQQGIEKDELSYSVPEYVQPSDEVEESEQITFEIDSVQNEPEIIQKIEQFGTITFQDLVSVVSQFGIYNGIGLDVEENIDTDIVDLFIDFEDIQDQVDTIFLDGFQMVFEDDL